MHKYPKLYFVIKLYMFQASPVPIIRSYVLHTAIGTFHAGYVTTSKQSSNLTLLGSSHITCMKRTNCRVYSRLLLMMGTEDARNIYSFMTK